MTTSTNNFPYGTFRVADTTRAQYAAFDLSNAYPLPEELPEHHPLLQRLEGVYPVQDVLPPWWKAFVQQADPQLSPLLESLSIQEFRDGYIEDGRWRDWKKTLSETRGLPRSPKLAPMVKETPWDSKFEERGEKGTPFDLDLVISPRPDYLLNMSSGNAWTSCQHIVEGASHEQLPGNLYDTGVAVAVLVPRGANIWEGSSTERQGAVLARTTLRVFSDAQGVATVVICRPYDNNQTLLLNLLSQLISLFEARHLRWGMLKYHLLERLMSDGRMGEHYKQQHTQGVPEVVLDASSFWLPDSWSRPYIDGHLTWLSNQLTEWHTLRATVRTYSTSL